MGDDHGGGVADSREHEDEVSDLAAHLHGHGMPIGQAMDTAADAVERRRGADSARAPAAAPPAPT
eukprot:2101933-Pleurochrysis_carterae.AAC.1